MYFEEYGNKENPTIVFLHGAHFVHAFGRQYVLSDKYHLLVPHIMGYGKAADEIFETEAAVNELVEFIRSLNKKVILVGFSIGAQLGFVLSCKCPELLYGAVLVSPWLIKSDDMIKSIAEENEKQFKSLKKKWFCNLIGIMNGLPGKQRKEFVEQLQREKLETLRNTVDNKITLDAYPDFCGIDIPVLALGGGKEPDAVHDTLVKMTELNSNCRYEIWEKAGHNIPPVFAGRFNKTLTEFIESNLK